MKADRGSIMAKLREAAGWSARSLAPAAVAAAVVWVIVAFMLAAFAPSAEASAQVSPSKITAQFPFGEPRPPSVTARSAILLDLDSGQVLYSRDANARVPMASTTKIMTAVLVLESLPLDKKVTVSANAVATAGSHAGIQEGEVLTVEQLLNAMLVISANEAAVALAEAVSGNVKDFAETMNAKAKALGLTNTHYVNPNGLNAKGHFSSAKDLATLTRYAMQNPVFRRIVQTREYALPTLADGTQRKFKNQNLLLRKQAWVTGVKTGSTPYAQYCLVATGTRDGVSLVSVVLGAAEDDGRWKESQALLEFGFSLYPRTVLADKGQVFTELTAPDGLDRSFDLVADRPFVRSIFKTDVVTTTVRIDRDVVLPVSAGEPFGTVEFTMDGKSLGSVNLVAAQSVDSATIKMILEHWQAGWPPLPLGDHLRSLSQP